VLAGGASLHTLVAAARPVVDARRLLRGARHPGWDPALESLAHVLRTGARLSLRLPLAAQRAAVRLAIPRPAAGHLRFERAVAGGVAAEWCRNARREGARTLLYFPGGGYSLPAMASHRQLVARLCVSAGADALVVDQRLAPEQPFPAALDDALAAYLWLVNQHLGPDRVAVVGDSAGGGLALALLASLRDRGAPLPAAAAVLSPWVDLDGEGGSIDANAPYDYVSRDLLVAYRRRYVREAHRGDPRVSPIHADLHGLPPLLVQAGGAEALLDDAHRIVAKAQQAGVSVELDVEPGMIHAWPVFATLLPRAQRAIDRQGAFLRSRVSCGAPPSPARLARAATR
jgi:acetyl esterase/lipase